MKVALYNDHHSLPFWHSPKKPVCLYDPDTLRDWVFKRDEIEDGRWIERIYPANEHSMIPILDGIRALELPGVMAHVSVIFDTDEKTIRYSKRAWVQFTTEPSETDANGIPIVVKENVVQVEHLWGGDNRVYSPYDFLSKDIPKESVTSEFWTAFFLNKLRKAKERAFKDAEEAQAKAERLIRRYSLIT